jgi:hypothetical protein
VQDLFSSIFRRAAGLAERLAWLLPDPPWLLKRVDAAPWRWALLLALAAPWVRIPAGAALLYPGHLVLSVWLGWGLLRLGWPSLRANAPLKPALALALFMLVCSLLRAQWAAAGLVLAGGAAVYVWGWAAFEVGRNPPPRHFATGAMLFLVPALAVEPVFWALQTYWPGACGWLNCAAAPGAPYPFRGGWVSQGQYLVMLILLLPYGGELLLLAFRGRGGAARRAFIVALTAAAGLGLLAGARWWVFAEVALGLLLLAWVLRADHHPADRLLLRGLAFCAVFGAVVLYGILPGYLGLLVTSGADARALGVVIARAGAGLSSERVTPLPVRVVNTGWTPLRASERAPIRVEALLVFTPRTGETRTHIAGEGWLRQVLEPGEGADLTVPVRLPPWVNSGYLTWLVQDFGGASIPLAAGMERGFRFSNAGFYGLDFAAENHLTALAARARALAHREPAAAASMRSPAIESLLGDAIDTLFFAPLWGHGPVLRPHPFPFDPARSLFLQLLHEYGLIGLGLGLWFYADLFRRSYQIAFTRHRGAVHLGWRLVPVAALLLAALGLFSGEAGRYHSLWGGFLLSGFVEGTYARLYPAAAARLPFRLPLLNWRLSRPPRPGGSAPRLSRLVSALRRWARALRDRRR